MAATSAVCPTKLASKIPELTPFVVDARLVSSLICRTVPATTITTTVATDSATDSGTLALCMSMFVGAIIR